MSASSQVHADSLQSDASGLILFDLTTKKGDRKLFSPHTTKTILDLKLLDVGYDRQRLTFRQIRSDLANRVAENVTVPTLELSDGTHLTDSWTIAEYLEANHPKGELLFGGSTAGKSLAAFINEFGRSTLRPHYIVLFMPPIPEMLDEESHDYFINEKIGKARFEKLVATKKDAHSRDQHIAQLIEQLTPIEALLNAKPALSDKTKSAPNGSASTTRWLCGTPLPTHADFCLFGWYVFSRTDARISDEVWNSSPALSKWTRDMREWVGEEFLQDLVP